MDVAVHSKDLLEELRLIDGVVERKTTIPILSHILLEASGDRLRLSATDLEMAIHTSCVAQVKKEGSGTVPARKLVELVRLLPPGEIRFRLLDNHWIQLTAKGAKYKMVGLASENFPPLPMPPKETVRIPAKVFPKLIERTSFAITKSESRYQLDGALLILKPQSLSMVATDGHRLALAEVEHALYGIDGEMRALVPRKALAELRRLAEAAGERDEILFAQNEAHLFFQLGNRQLIATKLTGQFPDFEAVLPRDNNRTALITHEAFRGALLRVSKIADKDVPLVRLKLTGDGVEFSASSAEFGEAMETVPTEYTGEPLTIGFNAKYLLDFLEVTGPDAVYLELKDESSAGQLRPYVEGRGTRYRYIVMPMRLQEPVQEKAREAGV